MRRTSVPGIASLSAGAVLLLGAGCGATSRGDGEGEASKAARPAAVAAWQPILDGKSLDGWEKVSFGSEGDPRIEDGSLVIPAGEPMAGVRWTRDFPRIDYEIELEAMRVEGTDFFCGLTFPVMDSHASLILGGWGGGVSGISSLDGLDASENETTTYREFAKGKWYRVSLRVIDGAIEAWLDGERIVAVSTEDRRIDVRVEVRPCRPVGLATYRTKAAIRGLRWRAATGAAGSPAPS